MKFLLILNIDVDIYINQNIQSSAHFSAPLGYLLSPRVVWLNCPPSAGDDCLARARAPEPRGPLCGARALSSLKLGFSAQSLASILSRHFNFSENGIHESLCTKYDKKVSLQS